MSSKIQGGATHVDIACDPDLVKLAISLTSLPVKAILIICFKFTLREKILIIFCHRIFACTSCHRNVNSNFRSIIGGRGEGPKIKSRIYTL